jgi:O-antigen/teichoic acid export membrane protein
VATVTSPAPSAGESQEIGRLAHSGLLNMIGAAVSTVTNLVLIVVVTRELHRGDAGVLFSATSVFLLVEATAGLGTGVAIVYFLPRLRRLRDHASIRRMLRNAILAVTIASLIGAAVLANLPARLGESLSAHSGAAGSVDVLWLLAIALPFAALADLLQAATRGFERMRTTVLVEKIGRPVVQLGLVAAAGAFGNLTLVALAWALPYIPSMIASAGGLRPLLRMIRGWTGPPSVAEPGRTLWGYALPRVLVGTFQLALQRLDIVLVFLLRGPVAAAIYTAATRFLVVGQFANSGIIYAMQPQVSRLLGTGDRQAAQAVYQTSTAWLVVLTWPLYLVAALFAHTYLQVFGHGYVGAGSVVVILAASMLLVMGVGPVDIMVAMAGRPWLNMLNIVIGLGLNVGIDLALIPHYGVFGAAIGWAVALFATNVLPLAEVVVILRMHPFGRATLAGMALSVGCLLVPPGVAIAVGAPGWAQAVVLVAGCVAYLGLVRWLSPVLRLEGLMGVARELTTRAGSAARGVGRATGVPLLAGRTSGPGAPAGRHRLR